MLDAARRVFGERGYRGASMDGIAAAARISKPMLYAYFGSKEDLFAECVREAGVEFRGTVRAAAGPVETLPPDQRLWRALLAVFTGIEQSRDAWDLLYPLEGAGPSGVLGVRAAYGLDAMTELAEELLGEAARAQGLAEVAVSETAPLARSLAATVMALTDWWRRHPNEPKELQALRAMNFAWRGFEQLLQGRLWLPPAEAEPAERVTRPDGD